jgi:hypothetical protein
MGCWFRGAGAFAGEWSGGDGYGWEELEGEVKVIDEKLLNEVIAQAKKSPRLRMNYNFHQSLDEKCHGWLCLPLSRLGIVQASLTLFSSFSLSIAQASLALPSFVRRLASALAAPSVLECGGAGDGGGDSSASYKG